MDISTKRIMIIDDEPYILKSLQRVLANSYDIITASGGQAAIDLLTNDGVHVDIILCDISMPGVNGADFYQLVAKRLPGLESRIIFMSGGAYTEDLKKFIGSIKNNLLEKPFDQDALLQMLERVCNAN